MIDVPPFKGCVGYLKDSGEILQQRINIICGHIGA